MSLKGQIEVNARIIDVQTGSVIAAENAKSRNGEGLEDMVFQMAQAIIRDFPLQGYVVRRSGRDVIIDLGKTSGIRPGMKGILYLLMFLVPLSGYVMSSAADRPISFFGLFDMPLLIAKNEAIAGFAHQAHELLAFGMIAVIALHVAGVVKHRLKDRNGPADIMNRML